MDSRDLYVLNPDYNLKNDVKRSVIIANSESQCEQTNPEWISIIHPAQAMILSFFSTPITIEDAVKELSNFLELSEEETHNIIKPFFENKESIYTTYNNHIFKFPKQIIIKYHEQLKIDYKYSPEEFEYNELDFESARLINSPSAITIMVTNQCLTNCVYCYADRNQEVTCTIPFNRIKEIIKEAKDLKIKNVQIGGGEFFLYKQWYELLNELKKYGYDKTFISTKVPISEADIKRLKEFPHLTFQFSFDSTSEQKLVKILDVSENYIKKMKNTFNMMDKYGISFHVTTVLTKLNSNKEELTEMYYYLSSLEKIKEWEVRIAFKSLYSNNEFESIKLEEKEREEVFSHLEELKKRKNLKVKIDKTYLNRGFFTAEKGSKSFPGPTCSANRSHMYILPDGNVTICEQMYWKKRFNIGNILKNSIQEVWSSDASLKWVNMAKEDFSDKSACKNCDLLNECYNLYPNKCWADVLKVYGDENWDYPDPRCKKAPSLINSII